MPGLPPWLQAADPARYYAEGVRIGDSESEAAASQQAEQASAARQQRQQETEMRMRQQELEARATQAAQKYQAQQAYQQAIQGGMDPIQAILKFGPSMGAGEALPQALRARQQNRPKPPAPVPKFVPANPQTGAPAHYESPGRVTFPPRVALSPQPKLRFGSEGEVDRVNPDATFEQVRAPRAKTPSPARITVPLDPSDPTGPKMTGSVDDPAIKKQLEKNRQALLPKNNPNAAPSPSLWDRITGKKPAGTHENPIRPKTQQEYTAVADGAFFVNPKDGKVYQKQKAASKDQSSDDAEPQDVGKEE